jgi:hypothetical protein
MCRQALWVSALVLLATVFVDTSAQAQSRSKDGFLRPGATGSRLGFGVFGVRTVNSDGTERTNFGASLSGGLSYAVHQRLALDADGEFLFAFTPDLDLLQVELSPGARLFVLPRLYARVAYAVRLLDPQNQLALVGGGYYLTTGNLAAYIEINYVAWSQNPVDPPIIPRIGIELRF